MQAPRCSYSVIESDAPVPRSGDGSRTIATRKDESGEKDKWLIGLAGAGCAVSAFETGGTGTGKVIRTRGLAASAPEKCVRWIAGPVEHGCVGSCVVVPNQSAKRDGGAAVLEGTATASRPVWVDQAGGLRDFKGQHE